MLTTTGTLKFLKASSGPPLYTASTGGAGAQLNLQGEFEEREIEIRNGREYPDNGTGFSLDRQGFVLMTHSSEVTDFYDPTQIESTYARELEGIVTRATGANKVVVFDHTLRSDDPGIREVRQIREPSSVVHNDYTDRSAPIRLGEIMPGEARRTGRFSIVNVWRPVNHPAITTPLALCDGGTIDAADLVPTKRRAKDRTGELMLVRYNPKQRWIYFPRMSPDEAILLKTFDSADDGRVRFSIHTAFEDPSASADAPPRESIESRCFVLF